MILEKLNFLNETRAWLVDMKPRWVKAGRRDAWLKWADQRIAFLERKLEVQANGHYR